MLLNILLWITKNKEPLIVDVDYMYRWFIIPRNRYLNIYFHKFIGSDAPTMHDHPWWSIGMILKGSYLEHTKSGSHVRSKGDITIRRAKHLHSIEIDAPVYTLFITGPRVRVWGFQCKNKWVAFSDYIKVRGTDRLASGCGREENDNY